MRLFSFRMLARIALWMFAIAFGLGLIAAGAALVYVVRVTEDLPDYQQLADYEPPVMSRVHAGDGLLIAEYARERRVFVPIEAIPPDVVGAFLSAEDSGFYSHHGVDPIGIVRAAIANIGNIRNDRRLEGGSTITQQVAKNFLLSSEQRLARKVREMVLAMRIERALSKDEILELYLNEIYLGNRAYGVAAASLNYFGKSMDELELHEIAYLAALPKAPNNYHPTRRADAAVARRNYVLSRMRSNGQITRDQMREAMTQPLETQSRLEGEEYLAAEYFVEEVRRQLNEMYGEDQLYEGGLSVRTTLDTRMQLAARRALRRGLETYDRRYGYRGPLEQWDDTNDWAERLADYDGPRDLQEGWRFAVVLGVESGQARIGAADGEEGVIPLSELAWARPFARNSEGFPYVGAAPSTVGDVLNEGDVIIVERLEGEDSPDGAYGLRQVPAVNGGVVALDPYTGRVLAMMGGYSFQQSQYNRVTQAERQPGSSFKPFAYAAALDDEYTPATVILDAPFAAAGGPDNRFYRPGNYSGRFYGPSTLRRGLEMSRNVMTVRLAQDVGMAPIADLAGRLNITPDMARVLPMALGAGETTLFRMSAAYGALVNGGRYIEPTIIDRVQDRAGDTIYVHDGRECEDCRTDEWKVGLNEPELAPLGRQELDPITAYQVVSMLEGAVERGTGTALQALERPMGGKTGTTNDFRDAWFMGFSPDLVVGVYVGFDNPSPLGEGEAGGRVAAPIAADMFSTALETYPIAPFRVPEGARLVPVDQTTGAPSVIGRPGVILEAFKPGTEPRRGQASRNAVSFGTGALNSVGVARDPTAGPEDPDGEEDEEEADRALRGLY